MSKEGYTACTICGHLCKPRGLGPHMRLAHGIVVKDVVKNISDLSGDVKTKRPSDYLRKKSEVIEVKIEEAAPQTVPKPVTPELDYIGKIQCAYCGKWCLPEDTEPTMSKLPSYIPIHCLKCYYKDKPFVDVPSKYKDN